jgi:prephenate dehydratase
VEGHVQDDPLARALHEITPHCVLVKVLGSYAVANHTSLTR